MSPTALNAPDHHDSFTLPAAQLPGTRGNNAVHATARRSPEGGLIQVDSGDTVYEEEGIRAKFTDRGAEVTSELFSLS